MSEQKNNPADPSRFITEWSSRRATNPIRNLMKYAGLPDIINLAGGMPNPKGFPFEKMDLTLKDGTKIALDGKLLGRALQYTTTKGLPPLVALLKQYHALLHGLDPESKAWDICITTGSQDGLSKSIDMLMEEGDSIILGSPAYPGMLSNLKPKNIFLASVPTDSEGINTEAIADTLANWETKYPGKKAPKVVYTIPTGSNPSGSTMTTARKRHLLALASQYDLMILEDDPYYFITFDDDSKEQLEGKASDRATWNCPTSMLSLDTEGRVLRFDSFSKVLSAGLRIGFMSGPPVFLMRVILATQASQLHTSTLCQQLTLSYLQAKGQEGFLQHVRSVRALYKSQRDAAMAAANKHLNGVARFSAPMAGMFLWIDTDVSDTYSLIMNRAKDAKLLLIPGQAFSPNGEQSSRLRAAFSICPPDKFDPAFQRLGVLLRSAANSSESKAQ